MDKKSEVEWFNKMKALRGTGPAATSNLATPTTPAPSGWWMYHGDPEHTGYVSDSDITAKNVGSLETAFSVYLDGPVLSVPAVTEGFVYVGVANYLKAQGGTGGPFTRSTSRQERSSRPSSGISVMTFGTPMASRAWGALPRW
jgi:hypothetical protein